MTSRPDPLAQSVKQRLFNLSAARGDTFNLVLVRYGIERLLYRLSASPHRDDFVLKGATLFTGWVGYPYRATRDLDLLAFGAPSPDRLAAILGDICATEVEPDGLAFGPGSIQVDHIREDKIYEGLRARMLAMLGTARIPLQIDVGFGDVITPGPRELRLEPLLDFPAPVLRTYPPETVVAEKAHVIVTLGLSNTRMKDYFDLWTLSETRSFDLLNLSAAMAATFERRNTPLPSEIPTGLSEQFAEDRQKKDQWSAFTARIGAASPPALSAVVDRLRSFLTVPLIAQQARTGVWPPRGPWQQSPDK